MSLSMRLADYGARVTKVRRHTPPAVFYEEDLHRDGGAIVSLAYIRQLSRSLG